jgi:hypothetical protein
LCGITAVGFDAIPWFFREQRRCDHPAVVVFFGQIAVEPVAARSCFIDEEEVFGFGLPLADHLLDVTLTGADDPEVGDLSPVILRHRGHGDRVFVNVHTDEECARLRHG